MFVQLKIPRKVVYGFGIMGLLLFGVLTNRFIAANTNYVPAPVEKVATADKIIALTFNVDWGEEYIPAIIRSLEAEQAKATFFITGRWAKKNSELLKTIIAAGHEIENHGYRHSHPDQLSVAANREEITTTESIIQEITGYKTKYYAPPYGERGVAGLRAAGNLEYQTILWTLDTVDWRADSTPEMIIQRVLRPAIRYGIRPDKRGAIVLMHPKKNTCDALPLIISQLKNEGYQLLTIDELITFSSVGDTTQ